jgi:hypothetical protein
MRKNNTNPGEEGIVCQDSHPGYSEGLGHVKACIVRLDCRCGLRECNSVVSSVFNGRDS